MKQFSHLSLTPAKSPVTSDEIREFHAIRIIMLCKILGTRNRIDGLTKFAKLDFLVRYPRYAEILRSRLNPDAKSSPTYASSITSPMVKYHYGPWDPRYYGLFAYLTSRRLLNVYATKRTVTVQLTDEGKALANSVVEDPNFRETVTHMRQIRTDFHGYSGTKLTNLIYRHFQEELSSVTKGENIPS